jgi:ubiquinone/menaquinone biosynthesis C-methylase UbiE
MSEKSPFGSYAFGEFAANDEELTRLERQATVAWPMERVRLLDAGLVAGMRVLDLASGPGFISRLIAAELGADGEVRGVDLNDPLLEIAHAVAEDWNAGGDGERARLSFAKSDLYDLDLPVGYYDLVYARFVFQHLDRPLDAMAQILRVLKPGGRILIADVDDAIFSILPEPPGLMQMIEVASAAQSERGGDRQVGRKLAYYLKKSGFEDITADVALITSDDIGLDAFLAITTRFKVELLPEEHRREANKILDSDALTDPDPATFALAGVYAVSGRAPGVSPNGD